MNSKLLINLNEGSVHVEGDEQFVRFVYQDFKELLSKNIVRSPAVDPTPETEFQRIEDKSTPRKPQKTRKPHRTEGSDKLKATEYKPAFRSDLNLHDLEVNYDNFSPKNHNEKILVFAIYLREHLQIFPCKADDIYTCYRTMKDKTDTPDAFVQAFRTAETRTHYIEFISPQQVKVTIAGDNYYNKRLKQKMEVITK